MLTAPLPEDEAARISALHELGILDTIPEQGFDDLVALAAHVCGVPMAAVSLVDSHRQWFKARTGLTVRELPRESAFCAHAILQRDLMIVPDTQADDRFVDNPLVLGDPNIRFYAGAPLINREGFALGTLCVIDRQVRRLSAEQEETLRLLARLVVAHLEIAGQVADRQRVLEEHERLIRESEALFQTSVSAMREGMVLHGADGAILMCNESAERILGLSHDQMAGRTSLDPRWRSVREDGSAFPGEDHPAMRALRENKPQRDVILGVYKPDGQLAWISVNAVPMSESASETADSGGTASAVVVTFADVTERRRQDEILLQSHRALQESQSRLAEAQRVAQIGSWEMDLATGALTWSDALFTLLEMDRTQGPPTLEALIARYHPDDRRTRAEATEKAVRDGLPYEYDIRVMRRDGSARWMHAVGQGSRDEDGVITRLFGTLMDVHDRKMAEERMRHHSYVLEVRKDELETANAELTLLAITDGLTELKNHRAFQETLAAEVEYTTRGGAPLSLILLDVDQFKSFNDSYGHPAGDEVLRTLGRLLAAAARQEDVVARYGGEEFALILPQTGLSAATAIAERLRKSILNHPWPVRGITASFGVVALARSGETGSEFVARADAALYRSKQAGRNRVTCDSQEPQLALR